jgi:hypothetical protein
MHVPRAALRIMRSPSFETESRSGSVLEATAVSGRNKGFFLASLALAMMLSFSSRIHGESEMEGFDLIFEGTLYEIGSEREKVLFRWKLWATKDGQRRKTRFLTSDRKLATSEELVLEDDEFWQYTVVHHEAQQRGVIRRVGDEIRFSYTKNGKTKVDSEDYVSNFVAGPMLVPLIQSRWDTLMQGKDLRIRMGVADRRETVGFKISTEARKHQNGEDAIVLKMKPSSFVISALVDPIYFTFSADGQTVYEVKGRTIPLREVDGKWKPSDVDGVYRKNADH